MTVQEMKHAVAGSNYGFLLPATDAPKPVEAQG